MNMLCLGKDLRDYAPVDGQWNEIHLEWLIEAYNASANKEIFFLPYFDKLAGNDQLRKNIRDGLSVKDIKKSWEPGLLIYRNIREKYILYPD